MEECWYKRFKCFKKLSNFYVLTKAKEGVALMHIQGASENMPQLLTCAKIRINPRLIKVVHDIQAYNHTILLIIKIHENFSK